MFAQFAWRYPEIDIKDITMEEKGKFRIEGEISISAGCCGARSDLGLPRISGLAAES